MNRNLFRPLLFATFTLLSVSTGFGQAASTSTSSGQPSTNDGKTNPLLGGTGTYGSAAQGSTTGGGGDSIPSPAVRAIDETFRRMDRNGDGILSLQEFRAAYSIPVGPTQRRALSR